MAIEIQCGDCGKRYRVDDRLAGKRGKCKNCGNMIAVPAASAAPAPAAPRPAARPAPAARSAPARPPAQRPAPAAPIPMETDPLEALAAMERSAPVEDEGLVALAPPPMPMYPQAQQMPQPMMMPQGPPMPGPMMPGPMPGGMPRRQQWAKPKSRVASGGSGMSLMNMVPLALVGLTVLLIILSFVVSAIVPIAAILVVVMGLGLMCTGGIMGLVVAFRESVACGLMCMFVPFYSLYYLITRWDEMKQPFLIQLCGIVIGWGGGFGIATAAGKGKTAGGTGSNFMDPPIVGSSMATARKLADRTKSGARLHDCTKAAVLYADSHKGKAPPDLATALSAAGMSSSSLTSPFGGQFIYVFPPGAPMDSDATMMFAYDGAQLDGKDDKVNIVYADSHFESKTPAEARQEIDRFNREVAPKLRAQIKP